ncbi:hypothetical protein AAC387_Pa01g3064 [Persea americana]
MRQECPLYANAYTMLSTTSLLRSRKELDPNLNDLTFVEIRKNREPSMWLSSDSGDGLTVHCEITSDLIFSQSTQRTRPLCFSFSGTEWQPRVWTDCMWSLSATEILFEFPVVDRNSDTTVSNLNPDTLMPVVVALTSLVMHVYAEAGKSAIETQTN